MKKITLLLFTAVFAFAACTPEDRPSGNGGEDKPVVLTEMPFSKGVNISDWFLQVNESYLTKDKYTEKDFKDIVSLGFEAIRLPIGFHHFTGPAPSYDLSDNFFEILDYAVDLAEQAGLYIILDNHTYFGADVFPPAYGEAQLVRVWEQMAAHYKNRSDLVIYEVMNEPGGTYMDEHWYGMQTRFLETIRAIDKKHTVIVKGVGDNRAKLKDIPVYEDKNLIYSFHFYVSHLFTHQKPSWDNSSPTHDLASPVPFPYDAARMPEKPSSFAGTDFEEYYDNYETKYGTAAYLKECIDEAGNFGFERGVPVFCGEFGVLNNGFVDSKDRAKWHEACVNAFALNQIGWTVWDYNTDFSMFDGSPIFEQNLNVDLLNALGLTLPPAYASGKAPELQIYDDVLAKYAKNTSYNGAESESNSYYRVNYEHKDRPYEGVNCIEWAIPPVGEGASYCSLQFTFWPVADFTKQYESDYSLEFMIRCDKPVDNLFVRFEYYNSDRGESHRTWRNVFRIGNNSAYEAFPSDGSWHKVSIPMKDFYIKGNNDQKPWVEEGEYENYIKENPDQTWDWAHINRISFATEGNKSLKGVNIYIDDVRVCESTK